MTVRQLLVGLAAILAVAGVFLCWIALASLILCFRQKMLPYVHWPEAVFYFWDAYDQQGMTDQVRGAAWAAVEVLGVAIFIVGASMARGIGSGGRLRRPFSFHGGREK